MSIASLRSLLGRRTRLLPPTVGPLALAFCVWRELVSLTTSAMTLGGPRVLPDKDEEIVSLVADDFRQRQEALARFASELFPTFAERVVGEIGWHGLTARLLPPVATDMGPGYLTSSRWLAYDTRTSAVDVAVAGASEGDDLPDRVEIDVYLQTTPGGSALTALVKSSRGSRRAWIGAMDRPVSAAARLGELWSTSPVVQTFVAERTAALTHDEGEPHKPYQQVLQMFLTSGSFSTQPLLTGWWLSGMAQRQALAQMHDAHNFLDSADGRASAFLLLIEWLRSWLPGYPFAIRLPHLDPHASRVTRRGFPNQLLPWPLELRRASLNWVRKSMTSSLRSSKSTGRYSNARLLGFRRQLWVSWAWREFAAAHAALDDDANLRLKALVDQFRGDCRAFEQSATERLMINDAARRAAVASLRASRALDAPLGRYYHAFRAIDRLIEAVGALITQFALGEGLDTVRPTQVTWRRGEDAEIRFTLVNEGAWFRMNQLVHIASPIAALQCLARIEGATTNFDNRLGEWTRHIATVTAIGPGATPDVQPPAAKGEFLNEIRRK